MIDPELHAEKNKYILTIIKFADRDDAKIEERTKKIHDEFFIDINTKYRIQPDKRRN